MRGSLKAGTMLVALLTSLAMAGCSATLPDTVDGHLVDDWTPVGAVTVWAPQVGDCLQGRPADPARRALVEVDCAQSHYGEIVHVGTFPGEAYPGPRERAAALAQCDTEAAAYLARPWGEARLELRLATPLTGTWAGGARWFQCEVIEVTTADNDESYLTRTGSLKGAVPAALLPGCVQVVEEDDEITDMTDVACAKPHDAEYVGVFRAPASSAYPASERDWGRLHDQCDVLKAKFLGVSVDRAASFGGIASPRGRADWAQGDHAVRCALSFGKNVRKSARGTKGVGF